MISEENNLSGLYKTTESIGWQCEHEIVTVPWDDRLPQGEGRSCRASSLSSVQDGRALHQCSTPATWILNDIVECELQFEKKVGKTFRRPMSSMTRWMPNLPGWPTLLLGHFLLYSSNWRDGGMGISSSSGIYHLIEVVRGEVKTNGQEGIFRTLKFRELWPQVLSYNNVNIVSVTTKICEPPSQREPPGRCCPAWSSCPAWWRQGGRWGQYRTIQTCTWHMEKNKSFLELIGIQSCQ